MRKYIFIIAIVGLCLVFSVAGKKKNHNGAEDGEPVVGEFTPVDLNSTKVQAVAKIILTNLRKEPDCSEFTLLDVTKAEHKISVFTQYKLKLRFKNANNETKKCKLTIMVSDDEIESIAARETNDHEQMTLNKPTPAPYIQGCECAKLTKKVNDEEEE